MLKTITQWTESNFAVGSKPSRRTVITWLQDGFLKGKKYGGTWYVDEECQVGKAEEKISKKRVHGY